MTAGNDIILGVTRAVDAAERREAVSRLQKLSTQAADAVGKAVETADTASEWATLIKRAAADTNRSAAATATTAATSKTSTAGHPSDKNSVYVKFEAMLLQTMIESMMPDDSEAVFGSGTAGKVWKSMMAEKVADQIARTGTLGIAKQISDAEAISTSPAASTKTKADNA